MLFTETGLAGALVIDCEPSHDERGLFARIYCEREFAARGITWRTVQSSTSFNRRKHTLRGMHYQAAPNEEDKLVRCTRGAIYDVIVDLRTDSATKLKWFATELTEDNRRTLLVPKGFAHGFMTLADGSEILYHMSAHYEPAAARGIRWNDPALAIDWPAGDPILSERDRSYPDFIV